MIGPGFLLAPILVENAGPGGRSLIKGSVIRCELCINWNKSNWFEKTVSAVTNKNYDKWVAELNKVCPLELLE